MADRVVPRWFGYNPPFIGGQQNVLSRQEDLRLIKNDLLQLLLTVPGERVHRPNFGSPIRQTLFDPGTIGLVESLISDLELLIATEEPRLTNVEVHIALNRDQNQMDISVIGALTNDPSVQFELELNRPFSTPAINQQEVATNLTSGNQRNANPLSARTLQ